MKGGRENHLDFLDPLLRFATIIGVTTKSGRLTQKPNRCEQFKVFTTVALVVSFLGWAMSYKLRTISNRLELYTDLVATAVLGLFTIWTVLEFGIFKRRHFQTFREELEASNKVLTVQLTVENRYSFYYETAVSYLFMVSLIVIGFFTEVHDVETAYQLLYKNYNNTFMITVTLMIRNYAICLRYRFMKINLKLPKINIPTFLRLLDATEQFSQLFEWQLLILAIRNVVWTISIAHIFIYAITTNTFVISSIFLNCVRGSLGWIMLFLASVSCGQLTKEVNKIKSTRAQSGTGEESVKTLILRQLLAARPVEISAAGFFAIDKSGFFVLSGLVTSYVIVLIQLNKLDELK